mmetsp:Transcript_65974/g.157759  ORF Transcript_65974/g.157759 Transcript_65974/m.157759 type:complete len:212 (+) Transcript_65974:734-1369(+)
MWRDLPNKRYWVLHSHLLVPIVRAGHQKLPWNAVRQLLLCNNISSLTMCILRIHHIPAGLQQQLHQLCSCLRLGAISAGLRGCKVEEGISILIHQSGSIWPATQHLPGFVKLEILHSPCKLAGLILGSSSPQTAETAGIPWRWLVKWSFLSLNISTRPRNCQTTRNCSCSCQGSRVPLIRGATIGSRYSPLDASCSMPGEHASRRKDVSLL